MSHERPASLDLVIVGAGISGLTTAFYAKRNGLSVRLLESKGKTGGVIRSEKKDNYLLEFGPNTVLPTAELMSLIDDANLRDEVLLSDPKLPRYIQFDGKLHALPMGPGSFFKSDLLTLGGKLRLLMEPFISARRHENGHDESLAHFAARRLGTEAANRLVAPFVSGIWAGNSELLSAESTFPSLVAWEREHGSIFKGLLAKKRNSPAKKSTPKGLLSFKNGLQTLPDTLAALLHDQLQLNVHIKSISRLSDGTWAINTEQETLHARQLVLACPTHQAAALFETLESDVSRTLRFIPYASLAVLHLAIKKSLVDHSLYGFGHLIAPSESLDTLGCLWSSSHFQNRSPNDMALLTVFLGGARYPNILESSDNDLVKKAINALEKILGIKKHPDVLCITRYNEALPQYTIGHKKRLEVLRRFEEKNSGFYFGGNFREGVSVGDVVKRSVELAGRLN